MALIGIGRKKKKDVPVEVVRPEDVDPESIFVTAVAAGQISKKSVEEGVPGGVLRIAVRGGGCSGLTYVFSYEPEPKPNDHVVERDGQRAVIDKKSLKALKGTVLDFDQELGRSGFVMKNPQATSTCSCGESFSIV